MTITAPKIGTRIMGLLYVEGQGTCLSFGTVTAHTFQESTHSANGITVTHDRGEVRDYRLSSYGDFWDRVTDHKPSAADVQPVRGEGWRSRFGEFPTRATAAEAVEDSRAWWEAKADPKLH